MNRNLNSEMALLNECRECQKKLLEQLPGLSHLQLTGICGSCHVAEEIRKLDNPNFREKFPDGVAKDLGKAGEP